MLSVSGRCYVNKSDYVVEIDLSISVQVAVV
jgi:hypothetical protein